MKKAERIQILQQRKLNLKRQLKSFEEFIEGLSTSLNIFKLEVRLQRIIGLFANLDDLFNELEITDTSNNYVEEKFIIQDKYEDVVSKAQRSLVDRRVYMQASTALNINNNSTSLEQVNNMKKRIKLPVAPLPTFDGRIENWMSFKDTFSSMIHNDDDLTNIQKLQYLKSSLRNEAARKIQIFSITEENYEKAWELLRKCYQNRRNMIGRHLSHLLRLLEQTKESAHGIGELADCAQQHIQSLESLGVKISPEIVVQIIEEKLHKSTLEKWEETLNNEFPELDSLFEFLYRTSARLSRRGRERNDVQSRDTFCYQHPTKIRKSESKRYNVFIANKERKCPVCNDKLHFLYNCRKFRSLPINDKLKIVKETKSSVNCLRKHQKDDCKHGHCRICKEKHNTLLYQTSQQKLQPQNKL